MTWAWPARDAGVPGSRSGRSPARPRGRSGGREAGGTAELVALADLARPSRRPSRSTRRSASRVAGPAIPSTLRPALRWNSRSAAPVSGPRMPSSRPASKPSRLRVRWSAATSSPRRFGAAQVEQPVAELEPTLDERGPGLGSDDAVDPDRPRASWNSRTAASVSRAEDAELVRRDRAARQPTRRCWRSRTASPRSPPVAGHGRGRGIGGARFARGAVSR